MPNVHFAQNYDLHVKPTRMHLLETMEKRRFSLSMLCTLTLLTLFSDAFTSSQHKMSIQMLFNKAFYLLQ